jgi:DnaK suppressor protein
MDIATSKSAVTAQSTSVSLGRFPADSVENHLADDWRPGETRGKKGPAKPLTDFLRIQRENLLELRESFVGSMSIIAQETRDKSALGTDLGDAGGDTYDRDFALSLLSEGSSAVLEIDEALSRIERGTYGICEMSGRSTLRAVPFARFTVECQAEIEERKKLSRPSRPFNS